MLLEARKHPLLERASARYGRRPFRRALVPRWGRRGRRARGGGAAGRGRRPGAGVWGGGAPWPEGSGPVIAFVNHSAWWDPVLALFLSHDAVRRDGYSLLGGARTRRRA